MNSFVINGGRKLSGAVSVSGSKNAALPILFSTLVTHGTSKIRGVPDIKDVDVTLDILSFFGADINKCGDTVTVNTENLVYKRPPTALVSSLRASSYLLGATASRFGVTHLDSFGGCNFDNRPVDMHTDALTAFGAEREGDRFYATALRAADLKFNKISVGATVNAILLAVSANGTSRIFGYAKEPHVISLVDYLNKAGASISVYEDRLEIEGRRLGSAEVTVIPDMIEAGTYTVLSVMMDCGFKVVGADSSHLDSFFSALKGAGVQFGLTNGVIKPLRPPIRDIDLLCAPYPAFPTDLQPIMAPLLAAFFGGRITDTVWRSRFGYLASLSSFGIKSEISETGAYIYPSKFKSSEGYAPDLRGGMAMLLCALVANGQSIIRSSDLIKRGYSDVIYKLRLLGADIEETKRKD